GVIGLTSALELARAGHTVEVVTADAVADTTSAVAAAIWFPYRAAPADPATGVRLMPGTVVHRMAPPDIWWGPAVPGHRPARASELPPGASAGTRCTLPVVDMACSPPRC